MVAVLCWIVMALFGLVVAAYLSALYSRRDQATPIAGQDAPLVSVLVAARDEEKGIIACLSALAAQDYPASRIEILLGDDGSTDATPELVKEFVRAHPGFHYHRIEGVIGSLRAKQNVLAQLAHHAKGEFLLVTDADIVVPPGWVSGLVGAFDDPRIGIACGPTIVHGRSTWAQLQGLDWLMGQVIATAHARMGIPLTAVGNNLAVRRSAYDSVGGYEGLPFSIVEDFQLFHGLCERGPWRYKMVLHPALHASSLHQPGLGDWIRQRRRWFVGGRALAWYNLAFIALNALVLPAIFAMALILPWPWAVAFLGLKVSADLLFLLHGAGILGITRRLTMFPLYEVYTIGSMLATPLLMLLPGKVRWKGRSY